MEYKIVYLTFADSFAVMGRSGGSGWVYIAKYISKAEAQVLLASLT